MNSDSKSTYLMNTWEMDCHRKAHTTIKWPVCGKTRILKSVQTYRGATRSPRFHTSELGNDVGTRRSASVPSRRWTSSKFYGHLANHILHVFFFLSLPLFSKGEKTIEKKKGTAYTSLPYAYIQERNWPTLYTKKKNYVEKRERRDIAKQR